MGLLVTINVGAADSEVLRFYSRCAFCRHLGAGDDAGIPCAYDDGETSYTVNGDIHVESPRRKLSKSLKSSFGIDDTFGTMTFTISDAAAADCNISGIGVFRGGIFLSRNERWKCVDEAKTRTGWLITCRLMQPWESVVFRGAYIGSGDSKSSLWRSNMRR